jgi:DNA-directed RNA polymerase subunit L
MEIKTIKKTAKELEIEITGETETILNPITEVLLNYKEVDYASYMADHPESNKRRLYIRVTNGKPVDILKKAVKYLQDEIKTFSKDFETKTKSKK